MTPVRYQLTRREVVRSIVRRRMFGPLTLTINGLFILAGMVLFTLPHPAPDVGLFIILLMLALQGVCYFLLVRLVDKAPWLTAPTTLTYSESKSAIDAGDMRQEYGWTAFGRWKRTPEHFLLFLGRTSAAIHVPVRAFTPAQLAEFATLLGRLGPGRAA